MLHPSKVCIVFWRNAIFPSYIILQVFLTPFLKVKRRICHHIICLKSPVQIICKGVCIMVSKICFQSPDSQVHLSHFPSGRIELLTENGNIINVTGMAFYKVFGLYKHASRTTARVINTSIIWLKDSNQGLYNTSRSVKLSSLFTFSLSKHTETILISTAKNIFLIAMIRHLNICEQINYIT